MPIGTNQLFPQICFTADPIVDLLADGIVEQTVHREITSLRVGFRIAEGHSFRMASIPIISLRSEGSHLELIPAFQNDNDAKLFSDRDRPFEKRFNLIGQCGRGDVVIAGFASDEKIRARIRRPKTRRGRPSAGGAQSL